MRIIIVIIILFFFNNFANASSKNNIINNFHSIKNLKFSFLQKINKKTETGECIISYPKKIYCKYNDIYNKVLVSNGKSLLINSDRNKQYYRYQLKKTPLEFILDKNFLITKIKELSNEEELNDSYSFLINHKNIILTVFFDKNTFNLIGWTTTDIYQNKVETKISNIKTNINFDSKIFNIQNYIN